MSIFVKTADESDLPWLQATSSGTEADEFQRHFKAQQEGTRRIYIAGKGPEEKGGYAILNWLPRYQMFRRLGMPEIQDIFVLPDFRRRGIAKALIAHCEETARQNGMDYMGIGVGLHAGFGPAQRLYASLGYIPDGNGATYDREIVRPGEIKPLDGDLCLMMVKGLATGV